MCGCSVQAADDLIAARSAFIRTAPHYATLAGDHTNALAYSLLQHRYTIKKTYQFKFHSCPLMRRLSNAIYNVLSKKKAKNILKTYMKIGCL